MNRSRLAASALLLTWIVMPFVAAVAYSQVQDERLLQETPQQYAWIGGGALVWVLLGASFWSGTGATLARTERYSPLWVALGGALGGMVTGLLTYHLVNTAGTAPSLGTADLQFVAREHTRVRLRTVGGPQAGLEFMCSNSKWVSLGTGSHQIVLHRGPLGLWWGELR